MEPGARWSTKKLVGLGLVCMVVVVATPGFYMFYHRPGNSSSNNPCKIYMENRLDGLPLEKSEEQTFEKCLELPGRCWSARKSKWRGYNYPNCYHILPSPLHYNATVDSSTYYSLTANYPSKDSGLGPNYQLVSHLKASVCTHSYGHVEIFVSPNPYQCPQHDVDSEMKVEIDDKFEPLITHNESNEILWDSRNLPFIFAENLNQSGVRYIEFSAKLPSFYVYGLGGFRVNMSGPTSRWLFNREDEEDPEKNAPSFHPFFLSINDRSSSIVWINTSYPVEVRTNEWPSVTFVIHGGDLSLHLFSGEYPLEVLKSFHRLIGLPALPPYWSLGFHYCNGFNISEFYALRKHNLIVESICGNWSQLQSNQKEIYAEPNSKHHPNLVIIDRPMEACHDNCNSKHFVKNLDKVYFGNIGKEKYAYYNPKNPSLSKFKDIEHFPNQQIGVIIDMNTPYNENKKKCPIFSSKLSSYILQEIEKRTICMNLSQSLDTNHFEGHNTYGHLYAKSVAKKMKMVKQDTFVMSLSTVSGSGSSVGQWNGRLTGSWDTLAYSLETALASSIQGFSLSGSPLCGYSGKINQDLCAKWAQLSSFLPFMFVSRNPDAPKLIEDMSSSTKLLNVLMLSLRLRYLTLPYFYTTLQKFSSTGEIALRPLGFEFFWDKEALDVNDQFLWGSSLMVSPALQENLMDRNIYLPKTSRNSSCWYDYYTGTKYHQKGFIQSRSIEFVASLHVRGGSILPSQEVGESMSDSRSGNLSMHIALKCSRKEASGQLFFGNDVNNGVMVDMAFTDNVLKLETQIIGRFDLKHLPILNSLTLFGVAKEEKCILKRGQASLQPEGNLVTFNGVNFKIPSGSSQLDIHCSLQKETKT